MTSEDYLFWFFILMLVPAGIAFWVAILYFIVDIYRKIKKNG